MKDYTIAIRHENGATLTIGAYCDISNDKYFRIYYCGSDTGRRYSKIGNAVRYLEKVAKDWHTDRITKGSVKTIPATGAPWNVAMFRYWYCGGPFPTGCNY